MITALVALASIITGCLVLVVVQLGVVIFHLGDLKAYTRTQIAELQRIRAHTQPHLPPELP